MIDTTSEDHKINQLRDLIKEYPKYRIDIEGVILDYISRSGDSLKSVFDLNSQIYVDLFTGSNADAGRNLLDSIVDSKESREKLAKECDVLFTKVASFLKEQESVTREKDTVHMSNLIDNPSESLGHPIGAVVWQISDIHFGCFNKVEPNPRELAFTIAKLAKDYKKLSPDIVIVSGDVSSIAAPKEFDDFKTFCDVFETAVWGGRHPEKMLVVPGNHDVTWNTDGTADRMSAFAAAFSTDDLCITPFGSETAEFLGGRVKIRRISRNPETVAPFAIVQDRELGLEFILFVSGYFSGTIPPEVMEALKSKAKSDKDLLTLIRNDEGAINQEYLFNISDAMVHTESTALGVIHHNPIQYGIETCQNRFAPQFLETLWLKGVPILLHGHVHQYEGNGSQRPVAKGLSYPVPTTTLCALTTAGSGRGLNIHLVGTPSDARKVDTIVWNISGSMGFSPADATLRYRFTIKSDDLDVEHGGR